MEPTQSPRPGWTAAILVALTVAPPFLLGAVHVPVIVSLTAVSLGVAALGAWSLGRRDVRAPVSALSVAVAVLAVVSLLQLVPWPMGMLAVLSPQAARAHADLAGLLEGPSAAPVSLDPAQTALAAARWLGLLAATLGVGWLLRGRRSQAGAVVPWLGRGLALGGLAQVVIGVAQRQWGARGKILGVFDTERADLGLVSGTFVNGNHAGAFLAVAALAGVGAAFGAKGWSRWVWGLAAVVSGAGVVVGASRGAILALVVGLVGLGAHLVVRSVFEPRQGAAPTLSRWLPWVVLGSAPVGLGLAWVGLLDLSERWAWEVGVGGAKVEGVEDAKLSAIRVAWGMVPEFWRLGMGADAFGVASPPFLGEGVRAQFAFVESDAVEVLLGFGLVPGGLALGLGLWAFAQTLSPTRLREASGDGRPVVQPDGASPALLGLGYGLLAWVISAGVSFNAEVLGLALPAGVVTQAVLERRRRLAWFKLSRVGAWGAVGVCVVLAGVACAAHLGLAQAQDGPSALAKVREPSLGEVERALAGAARWAPADGRRLGEVALLRVGAVEGPEEDRKSLALARLATERAPYSAPGFLARARAAARLQRWEEAADAYRATLERVVPAPTALVLEACGALPDEVLRARAVPARPDAMRAAVRGLLELKKPDEALGLALELRDRYPEAPTAHALSSEMALAQGQPDLAQLLAGQMIEAFPKEAGGYLALAKARTAQGDPLDALQGLRAGLDAGAAPTPLRLHRVGLLLKLSPQEGPPQADKLIEQDLDALRLSTLGDDDQRARYFYLSGLRQRRLGKHERARLDFERALKLRPQVPAYRQALAP